VAVQWRSTEECRQWLEWFFSNDRFITSPRRVPASGRVQYNDAIVPGLSLIVPWTGHRGFVLVKRFPKHPTHPTRRALGEYGVLTLEAARTKARAWLELID